MIAWRLTRRKYAATAFDGAGARRSGGRWNSKGTAVAYASEHLSLAALEYLVHVDVEDVPADLVAIRIDLADDFVRALDAKRLPKDWRAEPAPAALAELGDEWHRSRGSLALRVPSAIVPVEFNLVVNPEMSELARCRISPPEPFVYDARLLK